MDRLEELKEMIQAFRNFDARQPLWEWSLSEIERLREVLDIYGAHQCSCERLWITPENRPVRCTCGFEQALKGDNDGGKEG